MNQLLRRGAALRCCFLLAATLFNACVVSAQTAAAGTIEGRVLNVTSGRYIENARITVDGTKLEANTDSSGLYRLHDIPPGWHA